MVHVAVVAPAPTVEASEIPLTLAGAVPSQLGGSIWGVADA